MTDYTLTRCTDCGNVDAHKLATDISDSECSNCGGDVHRVEKWDIL